MMTLHGCDAMYRWMHVGVTGQWALVIAVIPLLALGLAWPASRKAIAVTARVITALALAWFAIYMYSANHTF